MPLTFPLPLGDFFSGLEIKSSPFDLSEALEHSETGGGAIITQDLGEQLWYGTVNLGKLTREEAQFAGARLDLLKGAATSFMVFPRLNYAPLKDKWGAALQGFTPQIGALDTDTRLIGLAGLPAAYELVTGDFLAFEYGSGPVRYALHKVQDLSVVASGTGATPLFEVRPHIRPGALVGAAVTLIRPACKARLVPGSITEGKPFKTFTEGMSFQWVQTLR